MSIEPISSPDSSLCSIDMEQDIEQSTSHFQKQTFTVHPSDYWFSKEITLLKDDVPLYVVRIQKYSWSFSSCEKKYTLAKPGDDAPTILFMIISRLLICNAWKESMPKGFFRNLIIKDKAGNLVQKITDTTLPQTIPWPLPPMECPSDVHTVWNRCERSCDIQKSKTGQTIWSIKPSTSKNKNVQNQSDLTITSHLEKDSHITALYAAYFVNEVIPTLQCLKEPLEPPYRASDRKNAYTVY